MAEPLKFKEVKFCSVKIKKIETKFPLISSEILCKDINSVWMLPFQHQMKETWLVSKLTHCLVWGTTAL